MFDLFRTSQKAAAFDGIAAVLDSHMEHLRRYGSFGPDLVAKVNEAFVRAVSDLVEIGRNA